MCLYGNRAVTIPRPELYVVYTGERKETLDELCLSDLYDGSGDAEIRVKVLRDGGDGDILSQYIRFCQIADENRKKYAYTQKTIDETVRQCMEENILTLFLASRKKEVQEIMVTLFDQEKVWEIHDYNVARAAEKKGRQEGHKEGIEEGIRVTVSMLKKMSFEQDAVVQKLIAEFGLLSHVAEEKVRRYWS